jgi:ABC-type lipoprotein export system ATPase subunit
VIRIDGLTKRYPGSSTDVLRGVDLEIADGDFVSLVGRSGCGKTTLLNIMGGLDSEFEGAVEVGGRALESLDDRELAAFRRREVGFVFQAYHLLDHLSCVENVALAARFGHSKPSSQAHGVCARAAEVLDMVGLAGAVAARPNRLSGGERQRVAMARALFNRPRLLLLDEPTGNLDAETGAEILDLLVSLHTELGMTVVVATHDEAIEAAGRRLVHMSDGRLHSNEGTEV